MDKAEFSFSQQDWRQVEELVRQAKPLITDETLLGDVSTKGRANFVTHCDTAVQDFLQRQLAARWPEIQFLGEEAAAAPDFSGAVWVLDPVDGTANLMHHYRRSAVSLALTFGGQPVCGVIYDPFADELFSARAGEGALCNGRPIHVSEGVPLADGLISVGTSPYERELADANFALFRRLYERCADLRRSGSAALDLAYVAAGRTEGYLERNLKPWDYAAGILLVKEAGGRVSDFAGRAPALPQNCDILAAPADLYEPLRAIAAG